MNQLLQPANIGESPGENDDVEIFLPRKHKSKIEEASFLPFHCKFHQKILGLVSTKGGQGLI